MRRRFILQENKVAFDYNDYLTIEALEDDCYVIFTNDIEYGIDGIGWKQLPAHAKSPIIRSGQTISFRGELEPTDNIGIGKFKISKKCNLKGNIMSMLFGDNAANNYSLIGKNYAFCNLFYNCAVINTNNLSLPATTLASYCYSDMFYNCTSLTTAPKLPATTLAETCYSGMFYGCNSLTTAPELPATTLANFCYHYMFEGCTSLTTAPELPATTLAETCYYGMFYGCTSLTTAPELPATTLASDCYRSMFKGCTRLTTAPTLPATTLASYCYSDMFYNCTSLTTAPKLPATTLVEGCYNSMFYNCSSLTTAPELPATTLANFCYYSMFQYCTSLTTAPELPATTLIERCYYNMFCYCNKLNYIKMLATNISATNCLYNWVDGVSSTGTFVKNAAMTSLPTGSSGIPSGWTVQNDGPININYLTIEALEDGLTAKLSKNAIEYCVDGDGNWKSLAANTATESINTGQILSFRGNLKPNSSNGIGTFTINKKCNLKGNVMSMLFGDNAADNFSLSGKDYAFNKLFYNCKTIINANNLSLPATTLANKCYYYMFRGCTSLTTVPVLPATTLANNCYNSMFRGCTSLTTAPVLPATTLANNCYNSMFRDCTSLTTAPALPATTLANYCYYYMFSGTNVLPDCSNIDFTSSDVIASGGLIGLFAGTKVTDSDLNHILPKNNNEKYCLPVTTLANNCYSYMFNGCTSLTTAPVLPATTLANNCYYYMFSGCTSLTTAPALPATTLANYCYSCMFNGCTSLTTAPALPATTLANYCYYYMFSGTNVLPDCSNIDFTSSDVIASGGLIGLFAGTKVTDSDLNHILPKNNNEKYCLPVTTLANNCYSYMFNGCTSLTTAPALPATTLANNCYYYMFRGCTSLTTAPALPATTLANECYDSMFSGCTSLTTAPALPATTLANYCYNYMFSNCSKLNYIKMLATDISASYCLYNWVTSVSSTGTFIKNAAMTSLPTGTSGIPSGWTVQDA